MTTNYKKEEEKENDEWTFKPYNSFESDIGLNKSK